MADRYFDTVISITDAKRSALFYEHVIPLVPYDLGVSLAREMLEQGERGGLAAVAKYRRQIRERSDFFKQIFKQIFSDLAPENLRDNMEYLYAIERLHDIGYDTETMMNFLQKFDLLKLRNGSLERNDLERRHLRNGGVHYLSHEIYHKSGIPRLETNHGIPARPRGEREAAKVPIVRL
jgi:hypothetical protein